ncbi:MAG: polysaccharide deacetylase family protein [Desulfobacteraceae bacterium]|nr:polysaccharide deacetylase family protein [Desulfobacteraceae bacterium]
MNDELKYRLLWQIGNLICLIVYYSGISHLYTFARKKYLNNYRTVVLTYHRVRDDGKSSDISVTSKSFGKQIAYLKKNFKITSLFSAVENLSSRQTISKDHVAISFDDGFKDNYQNAFPVMMQHNCCATIFLLSGKIGNSDEFLNIEEINKMKAKGMEFGSHTVNHPILSDLNEKEILKELDQSKNDLEMILGSKINLFAYPKGKKKHYNESVKRILHKVGYKAAFTTENGALEKGDNLYELKRIGIRQCPLYVFKVRLSGIFESKLALQMRQLLKMT